MNSPAKNSRKPFRQWIFRLGITLLFVFGLLLAIILNPLLTYAHADVHGNYHVFHNKLTSAAFTKRLDEARRIVAQSVYYDPRFQIDICLNDGSSYPGVVSKIWGTAFGRGFYNKVVIMGEADYAANFVELNGYKWNLSQLLAHEMVHCYAFHALGLWKSNPVASIPEWKWEGYPEFVARQNKDQLDLAANIRRLLEAGKIENNNWIQFADGTGTVIPYYKRWLYIQYCIFERKMSFQQILEDKTPETEIEREMMHWYEQRGN